MEFHICCYSLYTMVRMVAKHSCYAHRSTCMIFFTYLGPDKRFTLWLVLLLSCRWSTMPLPSGSSSMPRHTHRPFTSATRMTSSVLPSTLMDIQWRRASWVRGTSERYTHWNTHTETHTLRHTLRHSVTMNRRIRVVGEMYDVSTMYNKHTHI